MYSGILKNRISSQMAEPDKSKISEIRSRLAELEAEKKWLLRELDSEISPVVKKEKYGTPAAPAPPASSKERTALLQSSSAAGRIFSQIRGKPKEKECHL
jgi:hypothetical protein